VGSEENGYSVPDLNKTLINVTKELSNNHKKNRTTPQHIIIKTTQRTEKEY
jgi:ribosomal protein L39E